MSRLKAWILIPWLLAAGAVGATAQDAVRLEPSGDTLNQGLWWLYQLEYEKARAHFDQYTASNPGDPAGYFYKTAADWWQLAQEMDRPLPDIAARLDEDYQATVRVANVILSTSTDAKTRGRACMYAGGAEGLKGRWQVTQGQWVKAYFSGKRGHKLLKKSLVHDPTLYDAYLGLGIYDYYTDTLPGAQRILAALLIHGDRERGLQELQWAIEKGEHAPVEAKMFLVEIYTYHEGEPAKALEIAKALHHEFPKSPAMYLAEIIDYYELKQWHQVAFHAQEFLESSENEVPYYRKPGVFPAWYCLGVAALWGRRDLDLCFNYMNKILTNAPDTSKWVTFATLRIGQVHDARGEHEKAEECYRKVLSRPNSWDVHHEAKMYLKDPFHF